jgi:signal transduction histidine kinase
MTRIAQRLEVSVRFRTWPVAAIGLGSLLLLIVVSMLTLSRKAQDIYSQLDRLNTYHHNMDAKLRSLRSDVNLSGIFVRDYLLDVARDHAPEYRDRLAEFRRTNVATLAELRRLDAAHWERIGNLELQLDGYWQTFEPLFDWTSNEKIFRSASFLRREVVPRREAILDIAQDIEALNNANLESQRAEVARRQEAFGAELRRLLWQTLLLGIVVALIAVVRLRLLEKRSDDQRAIAEDAERQMRLLSQRLVATQEDERKNLSRELHDHVAQVLTALRMELGRIERTIPVASVRADGGGVTECRLLVDQLFRTVRDLALGLRPSMLDDLGLQPALEWHVRDFTQRYGVDVDLIVSGDLNALPDRYRTCVYRSIQEALTNCVRHAHAGHIRITVTGSGNQLEVSVIDDGIGFDPARRQGGLGLRGIDERVKELNGVMTVDSPAGAGTALALHLPLPVERTEASLASVAG